MSSGVSVNACCATTFDDIKMGHKFRYIVYALTPNLKEITVLKTAPPSCTFDDFVADMTDAEESRECRYAVYDADFKLPNGQDRSKLVFFMWSPENATIKQKMLYTSSQQYLSKALVGIGKSVQANDKEDLQWSNVHEILLKC